MKSIATLFAAAAFACSGMALAADEPKGAEPPQAASPSTPESAAKPPEGFVVLQRNIYVPVDNQGKVVSDEWVVVERQGYVTTDELKAITREHAQGGANGGSGNEGSDGSPGAEEPATKPAEPAQSSPSSPHTVPSAKELMASGRGPMLAS